MSNLAAIQTLARSQIRRFFYVVTGSDKEKEKETERMKERESKRERARERESPKNEKEGEQEGLAGSTSGEPSYGQGWLSRWVRRKTFGRTASGGALAPEPPRTIWVGPESPRIYTYYFFSPCF